ncbi:MAG: SRPBCC domain-containing protein [Acidobacteriota bacterium]
MEVSWQHRLWGGESLFDVFRQQVIPASPDVLWACLTDPSRLRQWFADIAVLALDQPFRFDFGDGDFFVGKVTAWREGRRLDLDWRFMGLGPVFRIRIYLTPAGEGTEVTVHDRGALTLAEVESLRFGWQDFLGRLAAHAGSGRNARYRWSETIGLGALLPSAGGRLPELAEADWWRQAFPAATVECRPVRPATVLATFEEPSWDQPTEALVETLVGEFGTFVAVTHRGWNDLAEAARITHRTRYAGLWQRCLSDLEELYR